MFINKIKSKEINKKINKLNQLNRTHQTIKGKMDPSMNKILPYEMVEKILKQLTIVDRAKCRLVSKMNFV